MLHATLSEYLKPHLKHPDFKPGIALLGCTHYPWIIQAIQKALPGWKVVNSAQAVAKAIEASELIRSSSIQSQPTSAPGSIEWIFTDPATLPSFAVEMIQSFT